MAGFLAGPLAAPVIQGAASLIGGLLGKDDGPDLQEQKWAAQTMEQERFRWLVKGAESAGFNPLTVLKATGGNMAQQLTMPSPLSTGAVIGNAIQTAARAYDPIRLETAKLENELLQQQIDQTKSTNTRLGVQPVRQTASPTLQPLGAIRPKARPSPANQERIPVYHSGVQKSMLRNVADRFGIKSWDSLTGGDVGELLGEIPGEVINTLNSDIQAEVLVNSGLLFGDEKYEVKSKDPAIMERADPQFSPLNMQQWQRAY